MSGVRRQVAVMLGRGFLTVSRTADLLSLSVPRIYQLLEERKIRGQRIGRSWFVDLLSVRAYLNATRPEHRPVEMLGEVERLLALRSATDDASDR